MNKIRFILPLLVLFSLVSPARAVLWQNNLNLNDNQLISSAYVWSQKVQNTNSSATVLRSAFLQLVSPATDSRVGLFSTPDSSGTQYGSWSTYGVAINGYTNAYSFTNTIPANTDFFLVIDCPTANNIFDNWNENPYLDTNYCSYRGGTPYNGGSGDLWFALSETNVANAFGIPTVIDTNAIAGHNWTNGQPTDARYSAGDTNFLFGVFTNTIYITNSGTVSNPITFFFTPNTRFSAPCWSPAAIEVASGISNIVVDGGINGLIISTGNGSGLAYTNGNSCGILANSASDGLIFRNLTISNIYKRAWGCNEYSPGGLGAAGFRIYGSHVLCISNIIDGAESGFNIKSWGSGVTTRGIVIWANQIYNVCMSGNIAGDGGTANSHLYDVQIVSNRMDKWSTWSAQTPGNGNIHQNGWYIFLTAGYPGFTITTNGVTIQMPTYYPSNYPTTFTTNGVTIAFSNLVGDYISSGLRNWTNGGYRITNDISSGSKFRLLTNNILILTADDLDLTYGYANYLGAGGVWSFSDRYLNTAPYTNGWPTINFQKIGTAESCTLSNVTFSHNYFGPDVYANTVITNVAIIITNMPSDGDTLLITRSGVAKTFTFRNTTNLITDVLISASIAGTAQQLNESLRRAYGGLVEWTSGSGRVDLPSEVNGTMTWSGSSCLQFILTTGIDGSGALLPGNTSAVLQMSSYQSDLTVPIFWDIRTFNNIFVWTNQNATQPFWNNNFCQFAGAGNSIIANNTFISRAMPPSQGLLYQGNTNYFSSPQGVAIQTGHLPIKLYNNFTYEVAVQHRFDKNSGTTNYPAGFDSDYNCFAHMATTLQPDPPWLNNFDFNTPPEPAWNGSDANYSWASWRTNIFPRFTAPFDQHTTISTPLFDAATFKPLTNDIVLLNAGTNLTSWGIVNDFYGNPRPTSGMWTIGAVQDGSAPIIITNNIITNNYLIFSKWIRMSIR